MYPINNASPQRVAIGAVVQISDGAVQTSGVSVKVLPQGTTASAGGGTIAYEEGVVHYLPTQAETNYASFILIAYKTGCIPATVTVVTSASATAGYAGLDWGVVANKTTTNALTGTTIATTQKVDVETIKTQAVTAAAGVTFPTSIASPTNITAGTITTTTNLTNAPTAGDFTATMKTSIGTAVAASAVASVTGNVGGNVTGSVGSVATGGISAASFAAGAVDAAAIAADAGTEIATAVWASAARTLTAATNFNNISTSDVLTQVNAAIDTAISELGVAAPTATPTLRTGLMLLYMALRNKLVVQTSGTDALEIYNDAGTKIASKLLTDTGGDYTEAEMT